MLLNFQYHQNTYHLVIVGLYDFIATDRL